jgi:hypothetical protein
MKNYLKKKGKKDEQGQRKNTEARIGMIRASKESPMTLYAMI